jgi:hypothetical protein
VTAAVCRGSPLVLGAELVALINSHVKVVVNYFLLRCTLTTQAASMFLIQTEKICACQAASIQYNIQSTIAARVVQIIWKGRKEINKF